MYITIKGQRWRLEFTNRLPADCDGICDPPDKPRRRIRIRDGMSDSRTMETLIHEIFHAAHWDHEERHVETWSADVQRVLTKLGYRRTGSKT